MEFFKIRSDIPFMRHALTFNVISFATFLLAVFFLATKGLHYSIEFTGGTLLEVSYSQAADITRIRGAIEKAGFTDTTVQNYGSSRDVLIRVPPSRNGAEPSNPSTGSDKEASDKAAQHSLSERMSAILKAEDPTAEVRRAEFVGPQVGAELMWDAFLALLITSIGIVGYLAIRFEWKFGVAAIIANLHDVVIILGFFAFFQWEFSLPVLAAVLAVLGYSVNESVVIADRIRENFRKMRRATVTEIIDNAITSTISRTIITHGSTQLMVCSMLIFGGQALHYFALALTIGICFGIYSSVLVMAPIVRWLRVKREDLVKPVKGKKEEAVV